MARTSSVLLRGSPLLQRHPEPGPQGPYKVFVVGSGRSGTHWLGHILDSHPQVHATVESEPVFSWVVEMARDPAAEAALFPKLIRRYRAEHRSVLPRHYVDKSHPNLWLAEKLADAFPEARFVAIRRLLEGTVASMLKHGGVRRWVEIWDRDPRPSRFLGVTEALLADYRAMSVAARCAVRVIAHAAEIDRLHAILAARMHVIRYEDIHAAPQAEMDRLSAFIGLQSLERAPMPRPASRHKWQAQLSDSERADIVCVATSLRATHLLESAPSTA